MAIRHMIMTMAAGAALVAAGATAASAHAHLVRATPAVGAKVHEAPNDVTLRFNEKIESAFSSIVVRDPTGKQVDKADAQVDTADRTLLRVSLPPLGPGTYKVEWKAVSADTHKVNGDFTFVVGE
jgi:copper resistance protein C